MIAVVTARSQHSPTRQTDPSAAIARPSEGCFPSCEDTPWWDEGLLAGHFKCHLSCLNRPWFRRHLKLNAQGQIDLNIWCIDSTAVRATRASAGAGKKGGG